MLERKGETSLVFTPSTYMHAFLAVLSGEAEEERWDAPIEAGCPATRSLRRILRGLRTRSDG